MNYSATDVKKLREETGATFADCKNALTEAKTWEEAVKLLEARSDRKAEKMIAAGRETKEGGSSHMSTIIIALVCSSNSTVAPTL